MTDCYATCKVSGNDNVGGVACHIEGGNITNCYATGAVSGVSNVGGVAGYGYGSLTNCAALNPSVTRTTGTETSFGRVISLLYGGTLSNNGAWEGMTVLGATVSGDDGTGIDGISMEASVAKTKDTYLGGGLEFGSDDDHPWQMGIGAYPLPVFYWQTTAPAGDVSHLE
jgi:hypothetical protein